MPLLLSSAAIDEIRKLLADRWNTDFADAVRIQYGGSVKPDNARALLSEPDVDGAASAAAGRARSMSRCAWRSATPPACARRSASEAC